MRTFLISIPEISVLLISRYKIQIFKLGIRGSSSPVCSKDTHLVFSLANAVRLLMRDGMLIKLRTFRRFNEADPMSFHYVIRQAVLKTLITSVFKGSSCGFVSGIIMRYQTSASESDSTTYLKHSDFSPLGRPRFSLLAPRCISNAGQQGNFGEYAEYMRMLF